MTAALDAAPKSEKEVADFGDRLERYFRENYTGLVRQFFSWGSVDEIQDAIQEALVRIYARFADGEQPAPENLDRFIHVAIQNVLKDRRRATALPSTHDMEADLDEHRRQNNFLDKNDQGTDEEMFEQPASPEGPVRMKRSTKFARLEDVPELAARSVSPEEAVIWKEIFRKIFDQLPPKWVKVAEMAIVGKSPEEIGALYEQNGYVLRRYARELICRALRDMAEVGDTTAMSFGRDFCSWSEPRA